MNTPLKNIIADAIVLAIKVNVDAEYLQFEYNDRRFRCLIHDDLDQMQICDGDFDRWANSVGAFVSPCPATSKSIKKAIAFLTEVHTGEKYCGTATPIIAAINEHLQKST